jgi:hypothetical protein
VAESLLTVDFGILEQALAATINSARSLEEIEAWLNSQRCVMAVRLAEYALKSNPVQRELFVEFRLQDGSTLTKIVNVFDLGRGKFRFHEVRDHRS